MIKNLIGIPSGFSSIDNLTSGWRQSDLIIIASQPAMGKTAFVVSMLKNIAVNGVMTAEGRRKIPCAVFSAQLSNKQFVNRILMVTSHISRDDLRRGHLTDEQHSEIDNAIRILRDVPIYIDDTPQLSIADMRTKLIRLVNQSGIKVAFIDYLELLTVEGDFSSREEELTLIVKSLKELAIETKIPIIVISQLSHILVWPKELPLSERYKPNMSHFKHPELIENYADGIVFIYRPGYYKIFEENGKDVRDMIQFIIAKHHTDAEKNVYLRFDKQIAQIVEPADKQMAL